MNQPNSAKKLITKWLAIIPIICLFFICTVIAPVIEAATADTSKHNIIPAIYLNGHELQFEHAPLIKNGVTFVPGKEFLEMLGYQTLWDEERQHLKGVKNDVILTIEADLTLLTINDNKKRLPAVPRVIDGELFLPLRLIAELDGRTVIWHAATKSVRIETNAVPPQINVLLKVEDDQWNDTKQELLSKLSEQVKQLHKIKLGFELVPASHYQDKLNVIIASGQKLDLAYMPNPAVYPPQLVSSIAWKLDERIDDYSQLRALPKESLKQLKILNDGIYGIPKLTSSVDGLFPVVNQAWLDKLGLMEPKTMEELYLVLKYFSEYDPDGNGKQDTYGLTGYIGLNHLGSLAWVEHVFNENTSRFEQRGDQIVDLALGEGTREALLWLNKAYTEGLLDPEFAIHTMDNARHSFISGKSGAAAMTLDQAAQAEEESSLTVTPSTVTPLVSLKREAKATEVTGTQLAYDGMYFISTFAKKDEVDNALGVINAIHEIASDAEADQDVRALVKEHFGSPKVILNYGSEQTKQRYQQIEEARAAVKTKELLDISLEAKLDHDLRAVKLELDQKMLEMKIKVIMGNLSIEDWDHYIRELSQQPEYLSIMKVFNDK